MRTSFYICQRIFDAVVFIGVNTQWKQVAHSVFINEADTEKIIVTSSPSSLRGSKPYKLYIDYSFKKMSDSQHFDFRDSIHSRGFHLQDLVTIVEQEKNLNRQL
jgi:hypothetical protein